MVANTVMNINSFLSLFLSSNTGNLAAEWRDNDVDGVMQVWVGWCVDQKEESPFLVKGQVTKKSKATQEIVTEFFKTFIETFGAVLFAESVWDSVNKTVYSRMVVALVNDKQFQETLKGELVKLKNIKNSNSGKKARWINKKQVGLFVLLCSLSRKYKERKPRLVSPGSHQAFGKKVGGYFKVK